MKGTMLDFLRLAAEKPELAEDLVELAAKHGFEFSDEVSEDELGEVAGGLSLTEVPEKPTVDRNPYFTGKLLTEKDLQEEQKYVPPKPTG